MNIGGKKKGEKKTKKEKKQKKVRIFFNERFAFIHWCFLDLTCFPRVLIICLFHQISQIYACEQKKHEHNNLLDLYGSIAKAGFGSRILIGCCKS